MARRIGVSDVPRGLLDPGILVVSGKGGTGKTTVAAALASVAAAAGARVLLTEVEGRGEIARALGVPDPGYAIRPTARGFDVMSISPMEAAYDYLHRYTSLDRLTARFLRSGGFDQMIGGAPGFRDLLITGKVYELARARAGDPDATDPLHDLVIVDAPPTGQLAAFLSGPETFAELIRVGPMKRRAGNVAAMFRSRARVLLVAVPEEMAVAETLEAVPAIAATGTRLAAVAVNRVAPEVFERGTARAGSSLTPARLIAAVAEAGDPGPALDDDDARRLLAAAREAVRRRRREGVFVEELRSAGRTFELPDLQHIPSDERIAALADAMRADETPAGTRGKKPNRSRVSKAAAPAPDVTPMPMPMPMPVPSGRLDGPLADTRLVLVCGSGGVGKTSISAAIAVQAATEGRRTVLLTVDPARRLATALRLPRLAGDRTTISVGGRRSMEALQLDTKRTFDELVERFAPDPSQRDRILTNPFYRRLADTLGGTNEYMAMEKLHQLAEPDPGTVAGTEPGAEVEAEADPYEAIVVDTPPTRSALSFLEAPKRLTDFLGGRFLRLMLWPTATAGRLTLSAARFGARTVLRTVGRLVGAETLADTVEFLAAFEGMYAGFRRRATGVMELLASPECVFVVVAVPTPPSLAEAGLFLDRLEASGMRAGAAVVNRFHPAPPPLPPGIPQAVEDLSNGGTEGRAAAAILRVGLRGAARSVQEAQVLSGFAVAHPRVALVVVPELTGDVQDVAGLRRLAEHLFEPPTA